MPRWQNLDNPRQEKFIRGYSVYPDGGCSEFPGYFDEIEGFGRDFKREIKRRYPTPVSFYIQAPTQRSDANYRGYRSGGEGRLWHSGRAAPF